MFIVFKKISIPTCNKKLVSEKCKLGQKFITGTVIERIIIFIINFKFLDKR